MADRPLTQQPEPIPDHGRVHVVFDASGNVTEYELAPPTHEEYQRGYRALMLSTSLETYRALLRGEAVPLELLDTKWVFAYGLRKNGKNGRGVA